MKLTVSDVVRVVHLEPVTVGDISWEFRIEVLRRPGRRRIRYLSQAWRVEHYRVRPTFPVGRRAYLSDEELLVRDSFPGWEVEGSSPTNVVAKVVAAMEDHFLRGQRPSAQTRSRSQNAAGSRGRRARP